MPAENAAIDRSKPGPKPLPELPKEMDDLFADIAGEVDEVLAPAFARRVTDRLARLKTMVRKAMR